MKLFGHPESGHAFKVKFFLDHAGIAHHYEWVDIDAPRGERQRAFRDHARFGEVPLLLDGERVVAQSSAILLHLAERGARHGAESVQTLDRCREWLAWEANRLGMCLPQIRSRHRYPDHGIGDETLAWLQARYEIDIARLAGELSDGRDWIIAGPAPTIADFSLSGYLLRAAEAHVEVPPAVEHWLSRLRGLPAWQDPYVMLAG